MNVSATQPIPAATVASAGPYAQIINLQRQAQSLRKEIAEENRSDRDAEAKARMAQRLQAHLQAIQAQIAQLQAAQKSQTGGGFPTQTAALQKVGRDLDSPFAYA